MVSDAHDAAWMQMTQVVGPAYAIDDVGVLRSAETCTFLTRSRIAGIVRPGNLREVQECVRVANRFQAPIYPISSGKNWGLRLPRSGRRRLLSARPGEDEPHPRF